MPLLPGVVTPFAPHVSEPRLILTPAGPEPVPATADGRLGGGPKSAWVNGVPYYANGLSDTVIIPVQGNVVILVGFEDFTGLTVLHCHIWPTRTRG
jgi:FtsP/CotA-like multicopper oxidase with cupredoxin domain